MQPTPSPTTLSLSPSTASPVGSQGTIILSHHAHGGKDSVVTQHTKKIVVIGLNGTKTRILPKLLVAHSPNPPLYCKNTITQQIHHPPNVTSDTCT
jgi:hypothetical protein